jgi:hypothetical protein
VVLLLATTCENGVTSGRLLETLPEKESPRSDCYARENMRSSSRRNAAQSAVPAIWSRAARAS